MEDEQRHAWEALQGAGPKDVVRSTGSHCMYAATALAKVLAHIASSSSHLRGAVNGKTCASNGLMAGKSPYWL